jgi:hypothetical protein
MPPVPPRPIKLALQNALFHCPRILFAWKTIIDGILALHPAQFSIAPKYCTAGEGPHSMRQRPVIDAKQLRYIIGERSRVLSLAHPSIYIRIIAAT